MSVTHLPTAELLAEATAAAIAAAVSAVLAKKRTAVLAVPGGRTVRTVLPALAAQPLPWERVVITLVDERWVPVGHRDSNETLVRSLLGDKIAPAELRGLYDGTAGPQLGALIARWPKPDVILLSMGDDGHIASLFPHDPANRSADMLAVAKRPDFVRVGLTPAAMSQASAIIVVVAGETKMATFERALADGPDDELPVRHALRRNAQVFVGP